MGQSSKTAANIFVKQEYVLSKTEKHKQREIKDQPNATGDGQRRRTVLANDAAPGYLLPRNTGLVERFASLSISSRTTAEETEIDDGMQQTVYCTICKKKFANSATYATHQQSEKHKKKSQQQQKPKKSQMAQQKEQGSKIPKGALEGLEKARAIARKDPAIAATVLWNIAKDIAQHDLSAVEPVLRDLLACLQRMEENHALCGSKGLPAAWSTRKILKTMLECRLALARTLYAKSYSRVESAEQYTLAVCQYLGISESCVEYPNNERNPSAVSKKALVDVSAIPRKFGRQEDVVQAIDAMDEAASALLAFSMEKKAGEDDALAWRGIGFYFIMHAFAVDKGVKEAAYNAVEKLSLAFELLGMSYFGNECAMLVIEHHMGRPGAQADVASAVVGSLLDNDLVRAKRLLDALNSTAFKQPWSQYMAEFVARRAMLDNLWIYQDAWNVWTSVSLALQKSDINVFMILNDGLDCILSPYKWCYSPACLDSPDQPEL